VWNIVPQSKGKGDHPCPFPNSLVERVIRTLSFVGDVVVDPWLGSGTVTAEAARLGRRWFGCDISTKYCAHAAERTEKAHKEFLSQMKTAKPEPKPAA
jgi:DNA modification methylase